MSLNDISFNNIDFDNYICPGCKGKENEKHVCDFHKNINLVDEKIDRTIYYPICHCPICYPNRKKEKI